jgi:hypothetical protein
MNGGVMGRNGRRGRLQALLDEMNCINRKGSGVAGMHQDDGRIIG